MAIFGNDDPFVLKAQNSVRAVRFACSAVNATGSFAKDVFNIFPNSGCSLLLLASIVTKRPPFPSSTAKDKIFF